MVSFYNVETNEPVTTMYISSTGKGYAMLKGAGRTGSGMMSFPKRPEVLVANGPGEAKLDSALSPKNEYRWEFTGLSDVSTIIVLDDNKEILRLPVKRVQSLDSYQEINKRFNKRGMKINLDCHIEYVCFASEKLNEGIYFRPKSAGEFQTAITDMQLFQHDNRADPVLRVAASATRGEGYREVSTPSLHVAVHEAVSSVHIDSYDFLIYGPYGVVIGPDVIQHVFDELLFRMPMNWLRRKNMPFLASLLQQLHPVLPNSTNAYSPVLGLRIDFGRDPASNWKSAMPRLMFESTVNLDPRVAKTYKHVAALKLASGGGVSSNDPAWVLSLRGELSCESADCKDNEKSVGLWFVAGSNKPAPMRELGGSRAEDGIPPR